MQKIRIDVDTQRGFCCEDGNLYVPSEPSVLSNIHRLVADASERSIPLIGSVDSHSYDAWEFQENGGPFPAHCVKGTSDWLKVQGTLPARHRFIPMSEGHLMIGESVAGTGNRAYDATTFSAEARAGVGLYFEKEVYSAFANPNAGEFIGRLVEELGGPDQVLFQVFGFCTGGFCVDAFTLGLLERGYRVQVVLDATAAIDTPENGMAGARHSEDTLREAGAEIITTSEALEAR